MSRCPGCQRRVWPWQAATWETVTPPAGIAPILLEARPRRWHRACWWGGWQ